MGHLSFRSTHVSLYGMLRNFSHSRGVTSFRLGGGSTIPVLQERFFSSCMLTAVLWSHFEHYTATSHRGTDSVSWERFMSVVVALELFILQFSPPTNHHSVIVPYSSLSRGPRPALETGAIRQTTLGVQHPAPLKAQIWFLIKRLKMFVTTIPIFLYEPSRCGIQYNKVI